MRSVLKKLKQKDRTQKEITPASSSRDDGGLQVSYNAQRELELFPGRKIDGLRTLYTPDGASIDVIFIHGLRGNSYNSWLHAETEVYWPVDLLRHDLPAARILAFGYDANVTNLLGPASQNTISDHAETLVGDLAMLRAADKSVGVSFHTIIPKLMPSISS